MDARHRNTLQVFAGLLVVAALAGAGTYGYFLLTFGSADHTQFTITAEEFSDAGVAENATVDLSGRRAELVAEAHRNGTARTVAETYDPAGAYVERNGTYYRVNAPAGPTVIRERPVLTIERVNETDGEVVPASELPPPDERAFLGAWKAWTARNTDRGHGDPPVWYVYETVPDDADSVFLPGQDIRYVSRDGRTFRVRVRNVSVGLDSTEYRLNPVADSVSAFVNGFVVNLTGRLNDSSAAPLERAIENGTYVSRAHTFAEAARPVRPTVRALGIKRPADLLYADDRSTVRYVRYEGRYYRVSLQAETTAA